MSRDPIVLTKYIPDSAALGSIRKADVTAAVDRSLRRLKVEQLGVLQLHWWDLSIPGYLEVFHWLNDLRAEGKIRWLGAVNFDTKTLAEICADGIGVITTQVQYSLLDRRVEKSLASLCAHNDVHMLCYGTVAGGFLSDVWLGRPEPGTPLENRSLVKYKAIIDEFGGWGVFQQLLRTLKAIAERHGVDIATVAMRYVLEKPQVGALIIGARNTGHLEQNVRAFSFSLDSNDHAAIDAALALGRPLPGDFYELERDVTGPHGSLMKRNLNAASNAHPTVPKGSA